MANQKKCIIWGIDVTYKDEIKGNYEKHWYILDSPRAGGKYKIEEKRYLGASRHGLPLSDEQKIRLSGYIAKQNLSDKTPDLKSIMKGRDKEWLEKLPPIPSPRERAYLLLEGLVKKTDTVGQLFSESVLLNLPPEYIEGKSKKEYHIYFHLYALSYCENKEAMKFLFDYLKELNFVKQSSNSSAYFQVTVQGFEKIKELSKSVHSKTAFIAMWIDSSMDNLKKPIETAIGNAGYNPLRIDDKEHNNKIDDEILNEIKRAKFMVCDLTSEKEKPRGSVYFEAGYAMGRGIPIVWTCDKKLEKERAFDIQNYNCLFWEKDKLEDFTKKLQHRIENTVGKGPLKGV